MRARPQPTANFGSGLAACTIALMTVSLAAAPAHGAGLPCMEPQASTQLAPEALKATIGGRPTLRFVPPHPRGIVYLFHGSGGSEAFATRIHSQRVLAALIAAGYGYAAAPSLERDMKRWNLASVDPAANADVAYMLALHRDLIQRGEITDRTPVFTMGMSNGGGMANLFGVAAKLQGLPVAAVADYMGPFPAPLRGALPDFHKLPPTLVILSQNDGLVSAERTGAVVAELQKGGAKVELHVNTEHRVCPATLALAPDLTAAERETWVSKTLVDAGLIDAKGERLAYRDKPVIDRDAMADLYKRLPGRQGRLVANELIIAWAGHEMRSEYAERQVAFFNEALSQK